MATGVDGSPEGNQQEKTKNDLHGPSTQRTWTSFSWGDALSTSLACMLVKKQTQKLLQEPSKHPRSVQGSLPLHHLLPRSLYQSARRRSGGLDDSSPLCRQQRKQRRKIWGEEGVLGDDQEASKSGRNFLIILDFATKPRQKSTKVNPKNRFLSQKHPSSWITSPHPPCARARL